MQNQIATVFPGQGSQSVGMLADIAAQYEEVKQTFAQASHALNYDLWNLVQQGPAEELDKTAHTQPALLAASIALWKIIQARKPFKPTMLAGHSLGEYSALVCANALDFTHAIKIVAARGEYMQAAVAKDIGAMAAIIGLDEPTVITVINQAVVTPEEVLAVANYNSIGQIVIAGHKTAVLRAVEMAKEKGAKLAVILPVSVPSHCKLMQPAAKELAKLLSTVKFNMPEVPVLNNVDVAIYTDENSIRDGLTRQLYMPVQWVATIQKFVEFGIKDIVECGPGKVLTGLNKRIDKSLQLFSLTDVASLNAFLQADDHQKRTA